MIHCPRGLPSARVAPQRCPILLTDDDSISHFFDYFHTTIEIVLDMGYIARGRGSGDREYRKYCGFDL